MDYWFSARGLSVGYDGVPLLEHIEIGVSRGEILTLIGPNGCGKSTILKSMIRQLRPIAGTVLLDGRSLAELDPRGLARRLAILMTERLHAQGMTGREVAATGRYPYTGRLGLLSPSDWGKVDEAIALVHAGDYARRPFHQLSDGQRQRLLLARAICQEPEVLVLDEPTSYLDIRHKLELLDVLKELVRRRDMAVVMSLHELDLAQKVSDRVVCVAHGRVDRCGTPEEIFQDGYLEALYGIRQGSCNALFGTLEMPPAPGAPRVFVIGGGGSGIPVYRALQRKGIPFAAGILWENDLDWPVARALAGETVCLPPYRVPDSAHVEQAKALMEGCGRALCCTAVFGEGNRANRLLRDWATARGLLTDMDAVTRREGGKPWEA